MEPKPAFIAGQVAVLGMEGFTSSYFAFASAPEDEACEFLIKRSEHQTNLAHGLFHHEERPVMLENIVGNGFSIEQHRGADVVFLAMGTGLAPLRSVLRHIFYHRSDYGKLTVLHGIRRADDQFFLSEIQDEWKKHEVNYHPVLSRPHENWQGEKGYVQDFLEKISTPSADAVALLCGSNEMMKQTKERLKTLGIQDENILTNY